MHHACGSLFAEVVIPHFRKLQILVDDKQQPVIAAFHVSDGIACCCVGFLKSEILKHCKRFEGMLAQVIDVHPGRFVAVKISCLPEEIIRQMTSLNKPDDTESEESLA